ncbi:hypothetical protein M9H77_28098 [Catharanthus roseus]|uniref:Uncharacterized protein n=1 Tax=Catharanthus roseus TaxID=4058 RepID=A0ACC0AEL0_CATRO|nr:hypothetical protein M9H77_28098 [Catharanthus roseus]
MQHIPDSAVGFLLDNLKEFVKYNADLIGGVGDNVNKLIKDLDTLKAFIKQYTDKYGNDFLESLANDVRDVICAAEDAIETYIVYASRQKLRGTFDRTFHAVNHAFELRRVGKDIEKVSKRVQEFYQEKAKLGLEALKIDKIAGVAGKKKTVFVVEEDNVVGFEDEAQKVIELLTGDSKQLEVISIIGMLGLGKTTLARKVFKDPTIGYTFFTRIFINVSQEYEKREVFLKILEEFKTINEALRNMSIEKLVEEVREELAKRQYLVVMDDVWSAEAWEDLKVAFPNNGKSSRVLITSRQKSVALSANPKSEPHYLRFLYPDESRELLRRKVFGENSCPTELERYETSILQKCNGLPLAIVVVAGILLNNRDRIDWWRKVVEGVDHFNPNNQERTIDLIKLSFNNLPYHLKPCFLYLGMFREDFEIPVWKLLRLWIAEGFVPGIREGCLEDTAEQYLEELVDRNLVMVGQKRSNGQIKTCRIHDTLRDFCKNEAKRENLLHEIRKSNHGASSSSSSSLNNARRLCINSHVFNYVTSKPSGKYVRSFLSFAKEEVTLPREHNSSIAKAFKLLRVLDIRSIRFSLFPSELCYLVLLKYIAISCDCSKLPVKLSNLWNLQTLIIETSSRELEINTDIWKMAQLRHVQINTSTILQKVEEGSPSLENLQTLSTVSPQSCGKEVFDRTPNLKKLGICGKLATIMEDNGESTSLFDSLSKLEYLENLKLLNDDITAKLHALPDEKKFPSKLTRLTLSNTLLDWKHMSTLGKLENLEALKLKDNAFEGEIWETEAAGGFPVLKVLHIGSSKLVVWRALASHFPKLTSLFIRHCTKLEALPLDLGQIPSLQRIDLHCTNQFVANSARKIQVFKLELQAQNKKTKNEGFKLSVYPPDH